MMSQEYPDTHNQAIMELGARICLPRSPNCEICPLFSSCFAQKNNVQQDLPVKNNKTKIRHRYFNYFVIRYGDRLAMFERNKKDVWQGLYDFYLIESEHLLQPDEITDPLILEFITSGGFVDILSEEVKHILSHQIIHARFFEVSINENQVAEPLLENHILNFYSKNEIIDLPKPVLVDNFLNYFFDSNGI